MNRPPDYCPQCDVCLVIEVPVSALHPTWDEERDGPKYPHGWHRWRTVTTPTDFDDRGIAVLECPECQHTFEWQAWPVREEPRYAE